MGECFFWYRPTRVVLDKRPLNGCVCVCVRACARTRARARARACVCVCATAKPYTSQTNDHCIRRNIHVFFHSVLAGQILHLEID